MARKSNKLHLTKEDKQIFKDSCRKMNAIELLATWELIDKNKDRFTKVDWRFVNAHLGSRGERILRNVVKYKSFLGPEDNYSEIKINNIPKTNNERSD